jgi:predicted HNH restriction endonuclease
MENLVTLCNVCHDAIHRGDLKITSVTGASGELFKNFMDVVFERKEGWKPV